jgi:hypothetical protein
MIKSTYLRQGPEGLKPAYGTGLHRRIILYPSPAFRHTTAHIEKREYLALRSVHLNLNHAICIHIPTHRIQDASAYLRPKIT